MAYDKNVFILGAGASVEAGAPVLNDFLKRARELLDNPRSGLTSTDREAFQRVFNWRGKIYPSLRFLKLNLENLEDLFSLIDMANLVGIWNDEKVRDDLIRLVLRTLNLTVKIGESGRRVDPGSTYSDFADLLEKWNNLTQNGKTELDGTAIRKGGFCLILWGTSPHATK